MIVARSVPSARSAPFGDGAEEGGRCASAFGLVVVDVGREDLEDLRRGVGGMGESGVEAVLCGLSLEADVGLGGGAGEDVEERAEGEAELHGDGGEGLGRAEEGADDVGLVGGEGREVGEVGGHVGRGYGGVGVVQGEWGASRGVGARAWLMRRRLGGVGDGREEAVGKRADGK